MKQETKMYLGLGLLLFAAVFLVLFCAGCGGAETTPHQERVVWKGYADEQAVLLDSFNEVMACLKATFPGSVVRTDYPYVLVYPEPVECGDGKLHPGCTNFSIQLMEPALSVPWVIKHEMVHWITKELDEQSPYFTCEAL